MELHVVIEGKRGLAEQIYRQIREAIRSGRLAAGEQLPPSRLLAEQLGVSRKTVSEAYARLTYDQLVTGLVGSGSFVASRQVQQGHALQREDLAGAAIVEHWHRIDMPLTHPMSDARLRYEYIGGATARALFPQEQWRKCSLHALRRTADLHGFYADPQGLLALREAIRRHIGFSRGVTCTPQDILVTNGAQQALDLIARVLVEPGCTVAVEDPGYPLAHVLFEAQRARVVAVPVDAQGIVVDAIPDGTRLIYTTPAHQFPLGLPMSSARRQALLERARELKAIVIEDDYDSEFRYEGQPLEPLYTLDRHGLVAYVGTFSKTLSPELRLGYVIAPPSLQHALTTAKQLTDWHTTTTVQWAMAKFIGDGHLLRHIRRCHSVYGARREHIIARFQSDLSPWFELVPSVAGFHVAALCRRPINLELLCHLARRVEVGLYPLDELYRGDNRRSGLLMGYGAIESLDIDPSLDRVRDILMEIAG
ncbi:GntR family transcriptional regulator/MocR family aminotransferase [Lysobacter niastensis]|uniref:GntR family transcriptional regulator/MocR family aminotransferase n=1 Tax=Lysobacter niastensis TaxID=380629 RepID=A0ABU1WD31_9GAMM|nr:PLP-dependent aminotransferase family protein [Lysobacter niastensis]MDR7135500.1 GntR family transcriptional regulator/MocR family aminotransferase [Lysobacter niastensis]